MSDMEAVKARYPRAELRKFDRVYTVWKSPTASRLSMGKISQPTISQKKAWANARALLETQSESPEGSTN